MPVDLPEGYKGAKGGDAADTFAGIVMLAGFAYVVPFLIALWLGACWLAVFAAKSLIHLINA